MSILKKNILIYWIRIALIAIVVCGVLTTTIADAQMKNVPVSENKVPNTEYLAEAPAKVDVNPVARDEEIRERIESVLEATGWFFEPKVTVQNGVVFLNGSAETEELKKWAGDLARNTQDVVAVANRIEINEPSAWDFSPATGGLKTLWRDFLRALPLFFFGLVILVTSTGAGILSTRSARRFLKPKLRANLLRNVLARAIGVMVFLLGIYIILRVSGLTQLALTVVGGTGLVGLAVGIAFREITENFLASIFLSMQRPFETGDLVVITGVTGYVQQLNVRSTIVMTLAGTLVQIPNATVYKNNLHNFTTNTNRREDFVIGIGYNDSISEAQDVARQALVDHPAVLNDPEPLVLADSLGSSTVNLRVYFWLNGRQHSWLKVRSSVIRMVKVAFQQNGISMPDEAREVVFPRGIPITIMETKTSGTSHAENAKQHHPSGRTTKNDFASTQAEGGLSSEAGVIKEQARLVKPIREEENLLKGKPELNRPQSES